MINYQFHPEKRITVLHTKNPYIIKRLPSSKKQIKGTTLDGYHALIISGCELPDEVISLKICNENLKKVDKEELSYFEFLTNIKADYNELNLQDFDCLENLKSLSLMENKIFEIFDLNGKLANLQNLNLSFNLIDDFTPLVQLKNLKKLNLAGNKIRKLESFFIEFEKLEEFDLSFNCLTDKNNFNFWRILSKLKKLKVLKINNNEFLTVNQPMEILENFSLELLDLSSNKLNSEQDLLCLINMKYLKDLRLEKNENLKPPHILIKQLKRKFNTKIVLSQIENEFRKKKILKLNYKNVNMCEIKKDDFQQEYFENKKDLFGLVVDIENKKNEMIFNSKKKKKEILLNNIKEEKNIKDKVFLTNINETENIKVKKSFGKFFDFKHISNDEIMVLANVLLKNHKNKEKSLVSNSYRYLNKYFLA